MTTPSGRSFESLPHRTFGVRWTPRTVNPQQRFCQSAQIPEKRALRHPSYASSREDSVDSWRSMVPLKSANRACNSCQAKPKPPALGARSTRFDLLGLSPRRPRSSLLSSNRHLAQRFEKETGFDDPNRWMVGLRSSPEQPQSDLRSIRPTGLRSDPHLANRSLSKGEGGPRPAQTGCPVGSDPAWKLESPARAPWTRPLGGYLGASAGMDARRLDALRRDPLEVPNRPERTRCSGDSSRWCSAR